LIVRYCPREVLELRLDPDADGSPQGVLDDLADRVEHLADRLLLYTQDGEAALEQVRRRQVAYDNALVRRSTLEDVFLRITGRSLVE
jgi:lipooligosaccharide transport system ATP-binding protein